MADKTLNPTPWVINTIHPGTRESVKAAVAAAKQNGIDGKPEGADQSLIEVGKAAIVAALDILPAEHSHAVVRADGRMTARGLSIIINIDGSKIL